MTVVSGPFHLAPGETQTVTFALPFAQANSRFGSVRQLFVAAEAARVAFQNGLLDPRRVTLAEAEPEPPELPVELAVVAPYPNPFTDRLTLGYELPAALPVRLAIYDVLGREVAVLAEGVQEAGVYAPSFDVTRLAAGVYLVRFEVAGVVETFRMVKAR